MGGYIEAIYPFEDMVALVCDEESKMKSDTQWNRILGRDVIKGTFFLCGIEGENFSDFPDELMEKYKKYFWEPQLFIPTPNGLLPIILSDAPEPLTLPHTAFCGALRKLIPRHCKPRQRGLCLS